MFEGSCTSSEAPPCFFARRWLSRTIPRFDSSRLLPPGIRVSSCPGEDKPGGESSTAGSRSSSPRLLSAPPPVPFFCCFTICFMSCSCFISAIAGVSLRCRFPSTGPGSARLPLTRAVPPRSTTFSEFMVRGACPTPPSGPPSGRTTRRTLRRSCARSRDSTSPSSYWRMCRISSSGGSRAVRMTLARYLQPSGSPGQPVELGSPTPEETPGKGSGTNVSFPVRRVGGRGREPGAGGRGPGAGGRGTGGLLLRERVLRSPAGAEARRPAVSARSPTPCRERAGREDRSPHHWWSLGQ